MKILRRKVAIKTGAPLPNLVDTKVTVDGAHDHVRPKDDFYPGLANVSDPRFPPKQYAGPDRGAAADEGALSRGTRKPQSGVQDRPLQRGSIPISIQSKHGSTNQRQSDTHSNASHPMQLRQGEYSPNMVMASPGSFAQGGKPIGLGSNGQYPLMIGAEMAQYRNGQTQMQRVGMQQDRNVSAQPVGARRPAGANQYNSRYRAPQLPLEHIQQQQMLAQMNPFLQGNAMNNMYMMRHMQPPFGANVFPPFFPGMTPNDPNFSNPADPQLVGLSARQHPFSEQKRLPGPEQLLNALSAGQSINPAPDGVFPTRDESAPPQVVTPEEAPVSGEILPALVEPSDEKQDGQSPNEQNEHPIQAEGATSEESSETAGSVVTLTSAASSENGSKMAFEGEVLVPAQSAPDAVLDKASDTSVVKASSNTALFALSQENNAKPDSFVYQPTCDPPSTQAVAQMDPSMLRYYYQQRDMAMYPQGAFNFAGRFAFNSSQQLPDAGNMMHAHIQAQQFARNMQPQLMPMSQLPMMVQNPYYSYHPQANFTPVALRQQMYRNQMQSYPPAGGNVRPSTNPNQGQNTGPG